MHERNSTKTQLYRRLEADGDFHWVVFIMKIQSIF